MRSRSTRLVPVFFALSLFACSEEAGSHSTARAEARERALTVRMSIAVDEVGASSASLRELLAENDGYVVNATSSERYTSLALRVPVARLEALRAELRALGEVRQEEEQAEDVTEQRSDTGARLRAARGEEERLLALMSERTATLADVIAVEERLSNVRARIEQLEAGERALAQRVDYAVVQVDLSARSVPFWRDPIATLRDAGAWGLDAVAAIVVGTGALVAGIGPTMGLFLAMLVALILTVRTLGRRRARA